MTRRPRARWHQASRQLSDLQNEITPGVYYESSKTVREVMLRGFAQKLFAQW